MGDGDALSVSFDASVLRVERGALGKVASRERTDLAHDVDHLLALLRVARALPLGEPRGGERASHASRN